MAHRYSNHPILAELDLIAQELDTTGNQDLATLVDEVSVELVQAHTRQVEAAKSKAKEKAKAKPKPKQRSKKNKKAPSSKEASTNYSSRRARIASAMKKIAKAQVAELEDIASELLKEGSKKAALEVLKIAEDLDSEYDYSSDSHGAAESKGDASKRFDRTKANKPKAKMDADEKEDLELPFGQKGEGYPMKQSSFDKEMDALIRLAMEGEEEDLDLEMSEEDSEEGEEEDLDLEMSEEESEDGEEEDADDMDLEGLDLGDEESEEEGGEDLDFEGLDLGEDDDELASMMEAMDHEASDRMYEADDSEDMDMDFSMDMEEESEEGEEESMEEESMEEDEPSMDEDEDKEGLLGFEVGVDTPIGGLHLGEAQRRNLMALAKKLAAKGEKAKAAKIARLAKKK